ncbi:hypothetical protein B0H34DRAFT_646183 [Crassisporium funariophilum]|nr:hypothetical protein B0H34DRAFT_646183 [Crassisporium funariophilum]
MTNAAPFFLVTAFTTNAYSGNPAAIVLLDTNTPLSTLGKISRNFNQPMTSIVSPTSLPSSDPKTLRRTIRFLTTNGQEVPVCGHGTLAAAKVLFAQPEVAESEVEAIEFVNQFGTILTAVKVEDGFIEIKLPAGSPVDVDDEEKRKLTPIINKAFGREVAIKAIQSGGAGVYQTYLLVELDEREKLGECVVDANALLESGYIVHVMTASSSNTDERFVSRMFAPKMLLEGEDAVCGSAHCLLTPYWSKKQGIASGQLIKAKQVSQRGGDLRVIWEDSENVVKLRGEAFIFASGDLRV